MAMTPEQIAAWQAAHEQLITDIRQHGEAKSGMFAGRQTLLLNTIGARSGVERTSPLAYSTDGDRYIVTASKGGAPTHPAWYYNLLANDQASVELGGRKVRVKATIAQGDERQRLWDQHVAIHTGIGEYPRKTDRVIPVVVLTPAE